MSTNHKKSPFKKHKERGKDTGFKTQLEIFFEYLQNHTATASMVTDATGVPQKNICRYKRRLERAGRLWQVFRKKCKRTNHWAWYLTTDPTKAPDLSNQLTLF